MANLLLKINGYWTLNHTIFPPYLYLYDEILVYRKRHILSCDEITISYNHIAQVILKRGIMFSKLDIINTSGDDIVIKYIFNNKAIQAKKIIDQKVFYAHAKHHTEAPTHQRDIQNFEKSLNRLKELLQTNRISKGEYNKKRTELLHSLKN